MAAEAEMKMEAIEVLELECVVEWVKTSASGSELLHVQEAITRELKKYMVKEKKGSAPKGARPPQLEKNNVWVEYTQEDAMANGWEEFELKETKTDGKTKEKKSRMVLQPGSEEVDDAHVFKGSVSKEHPHGIGFNRSHAMGLSAQRKKLRPELYEAFEEIYDNSHSMPASASSTPKEVPKMTMEERKEESERKKAEKAAEKELEKEAKKAKKEEEKAEKAALKAIEKAKKDEAKEAEKMEKAAKKALEERKKVVKKTEVVQRFTPKESPKEEPKEKKVEKVEKKVEKVKNEEWSCPDDGKLHKWEHNGKTYYRDHDNGVFEKKPSGNMEWAGKATKVGSKWMIDDSVEEPSIEESDDENPSEDEA